MNSVKIVEEFWERVWKARNSAAIDDFVDREIPPAVSMFFQEKVQGMGRCLHGEDQ